jgi:hypothetical protein
LHLARAQLLLVSLLLLAGTAQAQARIQGVAPDAQVTGGIGFAARGKLDNIFLGRLRLGALYAYEPYWVDAGVIVEAGAIPGLAIGGELEFNQFYGWFANAGLVYAGHDRITGHLSAGYMIFALEWQHDFTRSEPNEALLLSVRFPLGFWWFTSGREQRPFSPQPSAAKKQTPRPATPQASTNTATTPAQRSPAQAALDEAVIADAHADHAALAAALRRAYAADPDPLLWLRIADADLAQDKPALAFVDLQHFLAAASTGPALAQRAQAEARVQELNTRIARLRLTLAAVSGGERVEIDGVEEPGALSGYDVVLDPGQHMLRIRRGAELLLERAFAAQPGELVRLDLQLPAASAPLR